MTVRREGHCKQNTEGCVSSPSTRTYEQDRPVVQVTWDRLSVCHPPDKVLRWTCRLSCYTELQRSPDCLERPFYRVRVFRELENTWEFVRVATFIATINVTDAVEMRRCEIEETKEKQHRRSANVDDRRISMLATVEQAGTRRHQLGWSFGLGVTTAARTPLSTYDCRPSIATERWSEACLETTLWMSDILFAQRNPLLCTRVCPAVPLRWMCVPARFADGRAAKGGGPKGRKCTAN